MLGFYEMVTLKIKDEEKSAFKKKTKNKIIIKVFMQNKRQILKEHPQKTTIYAIFEEK